MTNEHKAITWWNGLSVVDAWIFVKKHFGPETSLNISVKQIIHIYKQEQ